MVAPTAAQRLRLKVAARSVACGKLVGQPLVL